jgi:isopentenyl-diphosphate delta-isomerase
MRSDDSQSPAVMRARKRSHLELCGTEAVEYAVKTTLFEDVDLLHNAVAELALDGIDTSVAVLGKRLRAPLVITGMTGGTAEALAVNRDLAALAERCGIAFGVGSQRVMQRDARAASTFAVRECAPTVLLFANLGLTQAARQSSASVRRLIEAIGADAVCLHLNPAQELIQPEGDRDFRGALPALKRLCAELPVPVIVKETGCGISRLVALQLHAAGVRYLDVSGAGGTSWVRVESLRGDEHSRVLAGALADWGIPTAASLAMANGIGVALIASGGIRDGVEVAKAIALGARLCGAALPIYRAYRAGGVAAAKAFIDELVATLAATMLLVGARTVAELAAQPVVLGDRVRAWVAAGAAQEARWRARDEQARPAATPRRDPRPRRGLAR